MNKIDPQTSYELAPTILRMLDLKPWPVQHRIAVVTSHSTAQTDRSIVFSGDFGVKKTTPFTSLVIFDAKQWHGCISVPHGQALVHRAFFGHKNRISSNRIKIACLASLLPRWAGKSEHVSVLEALWDSCYEVILALEYR